MAEVRIESRQLYEGKIVSLRVDSVRLPDGRSAQREVVGHREAVTVLAENDRGEILVINQFRYPAGEVLTELPAGIVEPGEECVEAAVRELQEETGWRPGEIAEISAFYTSPGFSDELLRMYYATNLTPSKLKHDEDEFIVSRFLTPESALKLAAEGAIRDAKTLYGIYWWLHYKPAKSAEPAKPAKNLGSAEV
jgi:ADP-ribose pyrophosphatase